MSLLICGAVSTASRTTAADQADLREHDQIEAALKAGLLELWFPRCLDHDYGGFLCDFDSQWHPAGKQPKSIVFQGRMTWLASRAMLRYPNDPRYREAADQGFHFLRDIQWDKTHGGWYPTSLDSGGDPKAAKGSEWKAGYHDGRALMNAVDWLASQ